VRSKQVLEMALSITSPSFLTISLGILILVLTYLLFTRIHSERRQLAAVRRMNPSEFSDFLRSNSVDGTIQVVAGKVSELLKTAFGCDRIIFLRKQRGFLELNYYFGIRKFNRSDFRLRFTPELVTHMHEGFTPRPLSSLANMLPESLMQLLREYQLDMYFPIFWRDNLYGIYFINSTIETSTASFGLLVASLAQSLSAAYHIKWHESRYEKLQQRISSSGATSAAHASPDAGSRILKLIRHRSTEALVPRLIDSVQQELGVVKVAFVYEAREKTEPLRMVKVGVSHAVELPPRQLYCEIVRQTAPDGFKNLDELAAKTLSATSWVAKLKGAGFQYLMYFPLSARRSGLLAVNIDKSPEEISERLKLLQASAQELLDNAEMFERMEELSYTDNLTGLSNQRYFHKRLNEEIDRARRYGRSLALIIFDMDDLKGINDRFGHQAGDAVLRRMGQMLKSSIRTIDIIARYGGDEFCVIMPEADAATCERFMERLQVKIATSRFSVPEMSEEINSTISLGGAVFPDHAADSGKLIFAADMALLRAKEKGRNAFVLFDEFLQTRK
jgi:diguanylate cyclase (GGDEF)-like protein